MASLQYLSTALDGIHPEWKKVLGSATIQPLLQKIDDSLQLRQQQGAVIFPPQDQIFYALRDCAPAEVKVVILGQDPYHGAGEAMGLSFSVPAGIRTPPSLRNIFKEQKQDLGLDIPECGNLTHWAQQGVLLLNSVMTVEADRAGSHGKIGWQAVTDAIIDTVSLQNPGCVFLLWGNWARSKADRIDQGRHHILETVHPSPLSASRGFMGCRHFSKTNQWLVSHGRTAIDWAIKTPQNSLF